MSKNYLMTATLLFLGSQMLGYQSALANTDDEQTISTRSIAVDYSITGREPAASQYSTQLNKAQRASLDALNAREFSSLSSSPSSSLKGKTREQIIAGRKKEATQQLNNANGKAKNSQSQSHASPYISFDIFSASSRLLEDIDYDGYFQTFSISFDADIVSNYSHQRARVFADLYLSRNGGPWKHYYTTDVFTLYDDSSDDEFEVLTTLDLGFRTDTYDVLIDLYEVGYSDIVATVSADDINSLYALPLESADRDQYVQADYSSSVSISAGSISSLSLLALIAIGVLRRK